ncbi:6-phosphogluconolactonase [Sulfuriferula plumbiphila]|uniref:6-phosphogluconolactonase n=1 Tax=Sulfuriferula plumbiphila TaxID=171865 RepID=A0A512LC40_9PROT|nr:6-phosphogluconolactonase [Sulfuriferula plumbiphila]BBP04097.1 6-phosphogluconolactonase [Sulfuriferula plumbiphila]GEP32035.1 6-phosphogluconolactonase [Sulfuriferula plumbiphila]
MKSSELNVATRWHFVNAVEQLVEAALNRIRAAAGEALRTRSAFHLVLAGGTTPRALYARMAGLDTDWRGWHVWFGDERCLPADHPERNSRMAQDAWLAGSAIPAAQIHPIPAELGASGAAHAYANTLHDVGEFDLVLLGLGEDGHTASLFPGHDWGTCPDSPDVLAVTDAPKPPPERVSLSARRLSRARAVLFLVSGAGKCDAVAAWRRGEPIPAAAIHPLAGVDVLAERICVRPNGEDA